MVSSPVGAARWRALPPIPVDYEGPHVWASLARPRPRKFENAGASFFETHERNSVAPADGGEQDGGGSRRRISADSVDAQPSDHFESAAAFRKWAAKNRKFQPGGLHARIKRLAEGESLYEVLGVADSASVDEIKRAYRGLALQHHPDKAKSPGPEDEGGSQSEEADAAGDAKFLLIQDAYEILSDVAARRQYDSIMPFDDGIPSVSELEAPTKEEADEKFFAVLAPVFNRNAKWSIRKPVPKLGTKDTQIEKTKKFYKFWFSFISWRDFSIKSDEYDLDEAECREERRWMERENQKSRKYEVQKEMQRITKLTQMAYDRDPRILLAQEAHRAKVQERRAEKWREANSSLEARRQLELNRKTMEEEDRIAAKMRNDEEVVRRKRAKEELKKWRLRLKMLCRKYAPVDAAEVQKFCTAPRVGIPILQSICNGLVELIGPAAAEFLNQLGGGNGGSPQPSEKTPDVNGDDALPAASEFVTAEISRLRAEWEASEQAEAAARLRQQEQTAKPAAKAAAKVAPVTCNWTREEMESLHKGIQKYPGGTVGRWELISAFIKTKTAAQVLAKTKEVSQSTAAPPAPIAAPAAKPPPPAKAAPAAKPNQVKSKGASPAAPTQKAPPPTGGWSKEQQTALESGLAKHPASMAAKERWQAIAGEVPGKSAKECLARFKEIRAAVVAARGGGGAS